MTGAIIPDDWDNTFICRKVVWPDSEQWSAILLGQVTRPDADWYWDASTGNPQQASDAVAEAYNQTVDEFFTEDCEEVPEIPITAFQVEINTPFAVPPGAWTKIPWADYFYTWNDPGFDFSSSGHKADLVGKLGVWHYDVLIAFDPAVITTIGVRVLFTTTGAEHARAVMVERQIMLSLDFVWALSGGQVEIQVFSSLANTILTPKGSTFFSGHYVGEVE